jgi:hypothetical protein
MQPRTEIYSRGVNYLQSMNALWSVLRRALIEIGIIKIIKITPPPLIKTKAISGLNGAHTHRHNICV